MVLVEKLKTTKTTATVLEVSRLLTEFNIHSVPVVTGDDYVDEGLVSMKDIIVHLVESNFESDAFFNAPITKAVRNRDINVTKETTIDETISKMRSNHVYRVAIAEGKQVIHVCSQTDIVNFIVENYDVLGKDNDRNIKLKDCPNLGSSPVLQVNVDSPIGESVRYLVEKNVSSVAVVSNSGTFVAPLCAHSFQHISPHTFPNWAEENTGVFVLKNPVVSAWATADHTIYSLLTRMVDANVFSVVVVDENDKPQRVITVSDILNILFDDDVKSLATDWASKPERDEDRAILDKEMAEAKEEVKGDNSNNDIK